MGSDSDWFRENGYDFLDTGITPPNWGQKEISETENEQDPTQPSEKRFSEFESTVDHDQLLYDIVNVILKNEEYSFTVSYTKEASEYYSKGQSWGGGELSDRAINGQSLESKTLDSYYLELMYLGANDKVVSYNASLRMFLTILEKTRMPAIVNGLWSIWDNESKSLRMESELRYSNYLAKTSSNNLLDRAKSSSEHSFKPMLVHLNEATTLLRGDPVQVVDPCSFSQSELKNYKLACLGKNGTIDTTELVDEKIEKQRDFGFVVATRSGTYIAKSGVLNPALSFVELMVNAYKLANSSPKKHLLFFNKKTHSSIYEPTIYQISSEEIDDKYAMNEIYITDGRHPLDTSVFTERCKDGYLVTTRNLYDEARATLDDHSNTINQIDDKASSERSFRESEEVLCVTLKMAGSVLCDCSKSFLLLDNEELEVLRSWTIRFISPFSLKKREALLTVAEETLSEILWWHQDGYDYNYNDLTNKTRKVTKRHDKYEIIDLCLDVLAQYGKDELITKEKIRRVSLDIDIDLEWVSQYYDIEFD